MAEKDHLCTHLKLREARVQRTKLGCEVRMSAAYTCIIPYVGSGGSLYVAKGVNLVAKSWPLGPFSSATNTIRPTWSIFQRGFICHNLWFANCRRPVISLRLYCMHRFAPQTLLKQYTFMFLH